MEWTCVGFIVTLLALCLIEEFSVRRKVEEKR